MERKLKRSMNAHLGEKIGKEGGRIEDLQNRLSKPRSTFDRRKRIWKPSNISRKTNLKPYKTLTCTWYLSLYMDARPGR